MVGKPKEDLRSRLTRKEKVKKELPSFEKIRTVEVSDEDSNHDVLSKAIIGEVKNMELLDHIEELCEAEGLGDCAIKYLGGLELMFVFKSEGAVNNLINNEDHAIKRWVVKIRRWDKSYIPSGRLTWINITGVPISCWKASTFKSIANWWGPIFEMKNCDIVEDKNQNLVVGRVLIKVWGEELIQDSVKLMMGPNMYYVKVTEEVKDIIEIEWEDENNSEWEDDSSETDDEYSVDSDTRSEDSTRFGFPVTGDEAELEDEGSGCWVLRELVKIYMEKIKRRLRKLEGKI